MTESARELGRLLQDLVNRVSHRGGQTLALMTEAEVTLQQVLLLTRLRQANRCSVSEFADQLGLSLPAISQAVERLKRLDMVTRIEDPTDRRRKQLATTRKAHALLDRLLEARSNEYAAGVAGLSPQLREDLARVLRRVVDQLS